MQNIVIHVKNKSKFNFLMELLAQFDYIEIKHPATKTGLPDIDFFKKTAGIWKDRNFNVEKHVRNLRKGKRLDGYKK